MAAVVMQRAIHLRELRILLVLFMTTLLLEMTKITG